KTPPLHDDLIIDNDVIDVVAPCPANFMSGTTTSIDPSIIITTTANIITNTNMTITTNIGRNDSQKSTTSSGYVDSSDD
ncbi:unnamed protein product, partial [Schistosoma margrebowiei]